LTAPVRRNLTIFHRAKLELKLNLLVAQKAKERQGEGGRVKVPVNLPEAGDRRQILGKPAALATT